MRSLRSVVLLPLLLGATAFRSGIIPHSSIVKDRFIGLKVPEPSDVACDAATGKLYIVSDNGILFETDAAGTILRKAKETGWDYEGVEVKGDYVYASDESARKVYRYSKATLTIDRTYSIPYAGARNAGFESIAWNETKHCFILVSEKNPTTIFELDEDFRIINQYPFKAARDVSSARWYGGSMYLLSDEDEAILRCDPNTYAVQEKFNIGILNPEGLAFDKDGRVLIAADDLQRLYFFHTLPATHE